MSIVGAAPRAAIPVSSARAEASRRNGARSRGPVSPEGKARSAQNALKHGLRAEKYVVLPDEDAAGFAALAAALSDELAPEGVLQGILVRRVAQAAWRLDRADRLEAEVLEERRYGGAGPGLALIRDGNATRSFETLMRYRGAAMAELMRSLRTLKALQAEPAAARSRAARVAAVRPAAMSAHGPAKPTRRPDEPERRGNPRAHSVGSGRLGHGPNRSGVPLGGGPSPAVASLPRPLPQPSQTPQAAMAQPNEPKPAPAAQERRLVSRS
jgi:hypothetical protein